MNVRFDHPALLLLGLLVVPLIVLGWRATAGQDRLRRSTTMLLRTLLLLAITITLAGPHMIRRHDHLTVIGLLDISGSMKRFAELPEIPELGKRSNIEYLRHWFRTATQIRQPDDRFGLIVFDGAAIAISPPAKREYIDDNLDVTVASGTNIAAAIELGLAMFPADTGRRLVLVTDGNETAGSALAAAKQSRGEAEPVSMEVTSLSAATQRVAIDVLPILYAVPGDVQMVRVESPPTAQPGQTVTVRMVLEATRPTTGTLTLIREGAPIDLNGGAPGSSRRVELPQGQSIHLAQVRLGETPVNRFEAIFEAIDAASDQLVENNAAQSFTATPSKGAVLIVDSLLDERESALANMLVPADIPVRTEAPDQFPHDLLALQGYDLIVLDNIAAYELTTDQQTLLARYVNDLGGGLIMIGGEDSFGVGGWNGTPIEGILPIELDPPKEMILPTAALVLVLDKSGSMGQSVAGARASQQEIANEGAALAIESLREDSMVGVVTFDSFAHEYVELQRNDNPEAIAERIRAIRPDGGTNLEPALRKAYKMLRNADVAKKRIVCLSDGRSEDSNLTDLVTRMAEDGIKITTIAVGDDADRQTLREIAELGGGEFRSVRNPRALPRVLVDSVQIINKPLIKEVPFTPVIAPTGSTLTAGMSNAPIVDALVVTAPRGDPKVTIEMTHPDGDPLLAHWQAGLGRAAAFTSDSGALWSRRWNDWAPAETFWVQLVRTISRPVMNRDTELLAEIVGDSLEIAFEAVAEDGSFLDYLQVDGTVYHPDGSSRSVRLQQVAPGRYETSTPAPGAGNYIVALNPRRGVRRMAPVIGGASRSTSPEYRRYRSDIGLLEEIVEITDGRRLDVENPQSANLFDRAGMPLSMSVLPVWRTLLWWVLGIILLDVACRRITWNYAAIKSLAQRALARVTPAHVRGRGAVATLETLRQASDRFDEQLGADAAGIAKLKGSGKIKPPPQRPVESEAPSPSKVTAAFDALFGRGKHPAPSDEQAEEREAPAAPDNTGSTETTSGLLAAKRRTRERLGE